MATHAYVVKEMHVIVGAVDYQCEVTGVGFAPTSSPQTITVACPDGTVTDAGPSSWSVTVNYTSSLLTAAFFRFLVEHDGEPATIEIEPNPVTEPGYKISADVTLTAGGSDWTVGSFGTGSTSLPVTGSPSFTDGP